MFDVRNFMFYLCVPDDSLSCTLCNRCVFPNLTTYYSHHIICRISLFLAPCFQLYEYMVYDIDFLLVIRYFFNKRTKKSTWEKPVELMTLFEVSYFGSHLFVVLKNHLKYCKLP